MAPASFIKQHVKNLISKHRQKTITLCTAKVDPISLRRSELIQKLCKSHKATQHMQDIHGDELPNVVSWASKFIASAHLLESYMLLHHHKEAKTLLYKFRSIDPDRAERLTMESSEIVDRVVNEQQNIEELAFLSQFAFVLKEAGYEEVPEDIVKQCIERPHTYDKIELEAWYDNYLFMRFWVYGRKEISNKDIDTMPAWKSSFRVDESKRILHERVIVASRSINASNMILKGFKDIPLDHLEALLPEAQIKISHFRKTLLITSLTITGLFAFFNFGMIFMTEFRMNLIFVMMLFSGVFAYRIAERHKTQKNKHVLAVKRMLYYKSTANNAGLILDIVNKAHEKTLKEALIVYGTALRLADSGEMVSEEQVLEAAYTWLAAINDFPFDIKDLNFISAFAFLQHLGLLVLQMHDENPEKSRFRVLSPDEATQSLLRHVEKIGVQ